MLGVFLLGIVLGMVVSAAALAAWVLWMDTRPAGRREQESNGGS